MVEPLVKNLQQQQQQHETPMEGTEQILTSGTVVMLITWAPHVLKSLLSAFVENLGPWMVILVPSGWNDKFISLATSWII